MTQATLPSSTLSIPRPAGQVSQPAPAGSVPLGIAQSASSLSPASQMITRIVEEEKGLGERTVNCCLESFSICKDFFLMIFHFFTFGCFKSAPVPLPSHLLPQTARALSPSEFLIFLEKRVSIINQISVHQTFEDGFFLLYKEYPQPQIREMLLGDFEMYMVKRMAIYYGSEIRNAASSPTRAAVLERVQFSHKIASNGGPASEQLKSFANTALLHPVFHDFFAQLYLKEALTGSAVLSADLKNLIKNYCEIGGG